MIAGRGPLGGRVDAVARQEVEPALRPEADVEQHDVRVGRGRGGPAPRPASRPCRRSRSPAARARSAAVPSRTTGWSSTIATRIGCRPVTGRATPAGRACRRCGQRRTSRIAPIPSARCCMLSSPKWPSRSARSPASGVIPAPASSIESDAAPSVDAVADRDRRATVLDGVGQRLLRDPEERELHVRRGPRPVRALEADLAAREALDAQDEPVERRPHAQVVEDRQAQVAADRPQPVRDVARDVRALGVAGRVEAADEQRQLLERVVVDVGGDPRPLRLGRGDDEVTLELRAAGEPGERPDGEAARGCDRGDPDEEQPGVAREAGERGRRRASRPRSRAPSTAAPCR